VKCEEFDRVLGELVRFWAKDRRGALPIMRPLAFRAGEESAAKDFVQSHPEAEQWLIDNGFLEREMSVWDKAKRIAEQWLIDNGFLEREMSVWDKAKRIGYFVGADVGCDISPHKSDEAKINRMYAILEETP